VVVPGLGFQASPIFKNVYQGQKFANLAADKSFITLPPGAARSPPGPCRLYQRDAEKFAGLKLKKTTTFF
jgi:hypothetical protein